MKWPLLENLKNPRNALFGLGAAVLVFDAYYYMMANLPGDVGRACVVGADLNAAGISFSALMSVMVGVMVAAVVEMFSRRQVELGAGAASGVGMFVGTMTVFCTVCTIPVISLFGLSVSLTFFNTYEVALRVLSVVMMGVGLWMLNKQLAGDCEACNNVGRK